MRIVIAVLALGAAMSNATAQELPCSQVRLIVPYPAGGATDVATRVVAERLDAALKKPIVVENRGGAAGNIGTVAAINAPPDGCTLLINATVIATFPHSFSKLAYDPFKDLAPVGGVGVTPVLVVAAPSVPANDMKGLIEWAKSKPEGLNYSTAGYGLQQHLSMEEIAQRAGVKLTHVAYRGGGTAMTDLIAARLDFGAFLAGTTKALVADGKLKALAVVAEKRTPLMPDVATTTEQGFPGMDSAATHFMLYAPPATPKPVIAQLGAALHKVITEPSLKQKFGEIGFDATPMSAEEVSAAMKQLETRMAPVIKRLNIKLD
ncbi:MAG: tripartite tricarboxylate transporter substrate binding protein [Xanthobacteraceae bacterium]|jgi:tripartite-type tricarboxylate transporter receptor subunit TctC